jgi:hypothetical protein
VFWQAEIRDELPEAPTELQTIRYIWGSVGANFSWSGHYRNRNGMRLLGAERRSDRSDFLLVGCNVLKISGNSVAIGGLLPLLLL